MTSTLSNRKREYMHIRSGVESFCIHNNTEWENRRGTKRNVERRKTARALCLPRSASKWRPPKQNTRTSEGNFPFWDSEKGSTFDRNASLWSHLIFLYWYVSVVHFYHFLRNLSYDLIRKRRKRSKTREKEERKHKVTTRESRYLCKKFSTKQE